MLWVVRRAQLLAGVSSLVTKRAAACCENARISNCPQPDTPTDFRRRFLFQPVCRLPGKFGWDPFSSLGEIAGEGREPRTANPRVGTNSPTFLGYGLTDFARFSPFSSEFIPPEVNSVVIEVHSLGRHVGFNVGGSSKKWHFVPNRTLLQISEVWPHVFYSSQSAVCVKSLRDLWRSWRNRRWKYYKNKKMAMT